MNEKYVRIAGTGSAAPDHILTNADLEKMVDTSDQWITSRSGIKERRIAPKGFASSDYAYKASIKALEMAGMAADELDMIILGTITPDSPLPSTACILQDKLKANNAAVVDIAAACSGFIYGLSFAKALIETHQKKNILVIGVETLSRIVNWKDRNTCEQFGDGAGEMILKYSETDDDILSTYLNADGNYADILNLPGGGSRNPITKENVGQNLQYLHMD